MPKQIMKKHMVLAFCLLVSGLAVACAPTEKTVSSTMPSVVATIPGETAESGGAFDKVPDSNAAPMEAVSLYAPDGAGKLKKTMGEVVELDAQELVDRLIGLGVLDEGTEVLGYETEGEAVAAAAGPGAGVAGAADGTDSASGAGAGTDGAGASGEPGDGSSGKIGTLDLSALPSDAGREMKVYALANTFIENYGLDLLILKVNGVDAGDALIYQTF